MGKGGAGLAAFLGLGALAATAAGILGGESAAARRAEAERAAETLRPLLDAARGATLRALVDETRSAAGVPQIRAAFANKVDTFTLDDLFQNEPWWRPHRTRILVLVGPSGVIMSRNVSSVAAAELASRAATANGGALARVGANAILFASASLEVADLVPRALILGLPIDEALLQSWSDSVHAGLLLSTGRGVSGAASSFPTGLSTSVVGHEGEGTVVDAAGAWAGVATAVGPDTWIWAVRPLGDSGKAAGPRRPLLLALAGLLALGALALLAASRRAIASALPAEAVPVPAVTSASASAAVAVPVESSISITSAIPAGPIGTSSSGPHSALTQPARRPSTSLPTVIASAAGQVFGRYTVLDRLGAGGMCDIYMAALTGPEGFQRTFVLKRLKPELALNRSAVEQFVDEAKLGSTLVHSNIVPVFDFGRVGDGYFIAQEYIVGRNVEQLCERHEERLGEPLEMATVFYIAYETLQALGYAHDKTNDAGEPLQIVHRDVSSGNIVISRLGEVKLIDFGIVKAINRVSKTDLGNVKGNAAFMAPEQARGLAVDRRADLFSLALVMFRALTGQPFYSGATTGEVFYSAASGPSAELFERLDKLSAVAARILKKALMPDPADRYASAEDFAADLLPHVPPTAKATLATLLHALFGAELKSGGGVSGSTGSLQRDAG